MESLLFFFSRSFRFTYYCERKLVCNTVSGAPEQYEKKYGGSYSAQCGGKLIEGEQEYPRHDSHQGNTWKYSGIHHRLTMHLLCASYCYDVAFAIA